MNVVAGVFIAVAPRFRAEFLRLADRNTLLRRATVVIVGAIVVSATANQLVADGLTYMLAGWGLHFRVSPALPAAVIFASLHSLFSALLPWTVREALRPCLFALALSLFINIVVREEPERTLVGIAYVVVASAPGLAITRFRQPAVEEWVRLTLVSDRYDDLRRELGMARQIHERMLPPPLHGKVRVAYRYEPMVEIGGDFVFIAERTAAGGPGFGGGDPIDPTAAVVVAVIDVTGHGIPAALAVNRLDGELRRLAATVPVPSPGETLAAINDYVGSALASDRMFATAIVVRVPTDGAAVAWASAGHPPGMIVGRDGSLRHLDSTTTLLGAVERALFGETVRSETLDSGERLLLFTDGAYECRDPAGAMLELRGFERLVHAAPRDAEIDAWVDHIRDAVVRFAGGLLQDDLLIVAVERAESVESR